MNKLLQLNTSLFLIFLLKGCAKKAG